MNRLHHILLGSALLVAAGVGGFLLMRTSPSGAPSIPLDAPSASDPDAALQTLIGDLGSSDPATRKTAQDYLAHLPYQKRAWLQRHADETINPETQNLLLARLEQINQQLATNPPPISLHVSHATLAEVIAALNAEMATDLRDWQADGGPPEPAAYSLDVTNQPFWDVIAALNKQHPFQISAEHIPGNPGSGVGYVLRVSDSPAGMDHFATAGPLFCYAYTRTGGWGPRAKEKDDIRVDTVLLCDPRVPVVDLAFGIQNVSLGSDSNGNTLALSGWGPSQSRFAASGIHVFFTGPRPDNAAAAIPSIKISATYTTAVAHAALDIPDIQQKSPWEGTIGDVTVGMPRLQGDNPVDFQFTISPPEKSPLVTLSLFQNDNWLVWSANGRQASDGVLQGHQYLTRPPMAGYLHIALAKRTYDFSARLEIKDTPFPLRAP